MDDDIFTDLNVLNAKKTYKKSSNKDLQSRKQFDSNKCIEDVEKTRPLTTKVAMKFLLEGKLKSKVCRYCLNITSGLSELDQIMNIGSTGSVYKVSIRDIVASFHPFKVVDDPNFPNKICQKCVDRALGAYLFTQQCEQAERAMLNCFDDIYEKFEKLDPVDRPKKRGRQKLNPNFNILHAEHYKVIDYAEPIINIVNLGAETVTKEPELNELECKKCWQVLPNVESLLNHEKVHPKHMWYHCRLCGKSFPKRNQLMRHNRRVHVLGKEVISQTDTNFKCKNCNQVTDNFIQHLQHVEKHKFKDVIEHLIEKRMDKLCVVCFNKGVNMTDLDKMVCLHGCHPDLMGDKTLYTLLASTLPSPKSYKYEELYVPSTARVMSITKRPIANSEQNIKKMKLNIEGHCDNIFQLSYPIIVSKDDFKTTHFYCYVLSDPEYGKDISIISDGNDLKNNEIPKTKLVEVVGIYDIPNTKVAISASHLPDRCEKALCKEFKSDIIGHNLTCNTTKNCNSVQFSYPEMITQEFRSLKEAEEMNNLTMNTSSFPYEFHYPEIVIENAREGCMEGTDLTDPVESISTKDCEIIESCSDVMINEDSIVDPGYTKDKHSSSKSWIFNSTNDSHNKVDKKNNCNFCWVFKNVGTCNYCEKPTTKPTYDKNNVNIQIECKQDKKDFKPPENYVILHERDVKQYEKDMKQFEKDSNQKEKHIKQYDKAWQCNVCLTSNSNNKACYCCSASKMTEYNNTKITLGNNKFFFQTVQDDSALNNLATANIAIIESVLDANKNTDIEKPPTNNFDKNIQSVNINVQEMDFEINTINMCSTENYCEAMDVEESPITMNVNTGWNESPSFDFNAGNITNTTSPLSMPVMATNLQFNIGIVGHKPPMRKIIKSCKKFTKGTK